MHNQNFQNLIIDYLREALAFFAGEEAGKSTAVWVAGFIVGVPAVTPTIYEPSAAK